MTPLAADIGIDQSRDFRGRLDEATDREPGTGNSIERIAIRVLAPYASWLSTKSWRRLASEVDVLANGWIVPRFLTNQASRPDSGRTASRCRCPRSRRIANRLFARYESTIVLISSATRFLAYGHALVRLRLRLERRYTVVELTSTMAPSISVAGRERLELGEQCSPPGTEVLERDLR